MIRNEKDVKQVVFTFDYELFLGIRSGTLNKCIIKPTDEILTLFKRYSGRGIFFVDAPYLLTLKKHNHPDFSIIAQQIQDIIKAGSNVELHIHPQWLDAYQADDGTWAFSSFDKYRLHDLSENDRRDLFTKSIAILHDIIHEVDASYKITAFRAGGWCIQPFEKLKDLFKDHGLIYDFSVNPGKASTSGAYAYFDFRNADTRRDHWRFEHDPCVNEQNGTFVEIPVTTVKTRQQDLWLNYYLYKKHDVEIGDGKSIPGKKEKKSITHKFKRMFNLLSTTYSSLGLDGLSHKYFKKYLNKALKNDKKLLTVVCHPKKLSGHCRNNIEYLLKNYQTLDLNGINQVCIKSESVESKGAKI